MSAFALALLDDHDLQALPPLWRIGDSTRLSFRRFPLPEPLLSITSIIHGTDVDPHAAALLDDLDSG
jgi:hypothetical protein